MSDERTIYVQTAEHSRLAVVIKDDVTLVSMQHRGSNGWFTEQGIVVEREHMPALLAALNEGGGSDG